MSFVANILSWLLLYVVRDTPSQTTLPLKPENAPFSDRAPLSVEPSTYELLKLLGYNAYRNFNSPSYVIALAGLNLATIVYFRYVKGRPDTRVPLLALSHSWSIQRENNHGQTSSVNRNRHCILSKFNNRYRTAKE